MFLLYKFIFVVKGRLKMLSISKYRLRKRVKKVKLGIFGSSSYLITVRPIRGYPWNFGHHEYPGTGLSRVNETPVQWRIREITLLCRLSDSKGHPKSLPRGGKIPDRYLARIYQF